MAGVTVDLRVTTAQATGVSTDTISGIESVIGSAYNDKLDGRNGYDNLFGGDGKDKLSGNGGDDSLYGGKGNDTLKGGGGWDEFVFDTRLGPRNVDTIKDFSTSDDDRITLDNHIFKALHNAGEMDPDNFVANASGTAMDANDYIVYDTDSGALLYDADGSGAGAAVQFAQIGTDAHPVMSGADFWIV
jgi:serralysin